MTEIDEKRIEEAFDRIRGALNLALQQPIPHLEALIERFRLELILRQPNRQRRTLYRALIDLLESELEERYAASDHDRETVRQHVVRYIRQLVHELAPRED